MAAERIGISQSKLSKIESGALLPSSDDVEQLARVYKAAEYQKKSLLELLRLIRTEYSSWRIEHRQGIAAKQLEVAARERSAMQICEFQPGVIPGLFQLPAYAERILALADVTHQNDIQAAVAERLKRQALLYDRKRRFQFIITEAALYSRFCSVETVLQQLQFLQTIQKLPNVTLGVLPNSVPLPLVPQNAFIRYDLSMVVIETTSGMVSVTDDRDIKFYEEAFLAFMNGALKGREATSFIKCCSERLASFASNDPQLLAV